MELTVKPGTRLFSAVDDTEVVVVRAPAQPVTLTIGGVPPVLAADERAPGAEPTEGHDLGVQVGKRYVDADEELELLCTKAGRSVPALAGALLDLKAAKALPASD